MPDFRFAIRSLIRTPSFTIAAIVALGLGVGSTAAVFSLLEGIVLRPLPYAHPERLVMLWENDADKKLLHQPISPVNFIDYRRTHTSIEDAAAWWRPQLNLADETTGDPIRVAGGRNDREPVQGPRRGACVGPRLRLRFDAAGKCAGSDHQQPPLAIAIRW